MSRLPSQYPLTATIAVPDYEPHMEAIEKLIDFATELSGYDNFKLELISAISLDSNETICSYEIHQLPELDVKKLVYSKYL